MTVKNHILFTASRLDVPGGIERAVINTANLLVENGHQVTLLVLDTISDVFYPLSKNVLIGHLPLDFGVGQEGNVLSRKIRLAQHVISLKRELKKRKADIVVATDYVHAIASQLAAPKKIRVYGWEHHHFRHLEKSSFWATLHRYAYPKLTAVICLNKEEASFYKAIGCQTMVIPNFVSISGATALLENNTLLTVGWLSHIKGADYIPQVAKIILENYPEWKWRIIGFGTGLPHVLSNMEVVPPLGPAITQEYLNASLYILPSRLECFPMVLLKAMSNGVPCIAFNCPTGPKHIINQDVDGVLVQNGDVVALAAAIGTLIENEEKRKRLGQAALHNVQRFDPKKIYPLWENLINEQ